MSDRDWDHPSDGSTLELGEPSGMTQAQLRQWIEFNGGSVEVAQSWWLTVVVLALLISLLVASAVIGE